MLEELYKFLEELNNKIPFNSMVTLSLEDNNLIIQTLFRKNNIPYFYMDSRNENHFSSFNSEKFIDNYIEDLMNLYNNIEKETLSKYEIINKTILFKENQMTEQTNEQVEELQKIIFFDTETSGFLKKDLPADDPDQAWCIQIGAILATEKETLEELNLIIKPAGRSMNPKAEEIHGISLEYAEEHGLPELEVTEAFGLMLRKADKIVCHNYDFDWKYVQHMMERNLDNLSDEARSAFYLDLPNQCTMKDKIIIKFCGLKGKTGRPKWPKLIELHQILFGEKFDDAHDAFADISATAKCYFELVRRGIIE